MALLLLTNRTGLIGLVLSVFITVGEVPTVLGAGTLRLPAETEPHSRTVMIWPSSSEIWGDLLKPVQKDIANIARAIVKYEPVTMLVNARLLDAAKKELGSDCTVELMVVESDDLWARDTLPVFIKRNDGQVEGVNLHFNGWGKKQEHGKDGKVAATVLKAWNITDKSASFVGEGGALETDGEGTLLVTESSIVNDNRNPGRSRDELEQDLKTTLGVSKVIWFKGVKGGDITDAHVDALARFAKPGVVVLSRPFVGNGTEVEGDDEETDEKPDVWAVSSDQALEVLKTATDAKGNRIRVVKIQDPDPTKISGTGKGIPNNDFLSSYLNYYVINGAVIVPKFGDKAADAKAQATLRDLYPGREIVGVNIDHLAAGGGGIHCATHELIE